MQIAMFLSDTSRAVGLLSRSGTAAPSLRVTEASQSGAAREDDSAQLSPEARAAAAADASQRGDEGDAGDSAASRPTGTDGEPLSEEEVEQLRELAARDQEVRTHEQAHIAAAGSLFRGGPTYSYQTGPDGKRYAVGGRVQIDTSEGSTPEETIQKAQQIRASALAPAEPSSTDLRVASQATRMESEARAELAAERAEAEETDSSREGEADGSGSTDQYNPGQNKPRQLNLTAIDAYASTTGRGDLNISRLNIAA